VSKEFLCPVPWETVSTKPNGELRVCCHANQAPCRGLLIKEDGTPYTLQAEDVLNFRNSPKLKNMRKLMLKGEAPSECKRCIEEEAVGQESFRKKKLSTSRYSKEFYLENTTEEGEIKQENVPIQSVDLRFGNECNLVCRMCSPESSDKWYQDFQDYYQTDSFRIGTQRIHIEKDLKGKSFIKDYKWYRNPVAQKNMALLSQDLHEVDLIGGEPLLIKESWHYLETLVEMGVSEKIKVLYVTNLTFLPKNFEKIWEKFRSISIDVSLDGKGQVFEYQRFPAKWDSVWQNYLSLTNNINVTHLSINSTLTCYNIFHLPDFLFFLYGNNPNRLKNYSHHSCHTPKHLNIKCLPAHIKKQLTELFLNKIEEFKTQMDEENALKATSLLNSALNFLNGEDLDKCHWEKFKDFTRFFDERRDQKILDVAPMLEEEFKR
jgi:hypothetical protein